MIDDTELVERVRDADLLSDRQLEQARVLQDREDRSLYEVLVAHQFVDEGPLVAIVSEVLNVASVDPREFDPNGEVLDLVPADVAFDNWALPLQTERIDGQARLVLAMRDPIDMMAMDEIADYTDIDIRPVLAGPRALHDALVDSYDRVEPLDLEIPDSEGLESGTHPGLVTSELSKGDWEEGTAADGGEPLETQDETMAQAAEGGDEPSDPNSSAIGRIPVKQVAASELGEESSDDSASLSLDEADEAGSDDASLSFEDADDDPDPLFEEADDAEDTGLALGDPPSDPNTSDPPLDLGTPLPSTQEDDLEESSTGGGTVVAKAPKVDEGDVVDESSNGGGTVVAEAPKVDGAPSPDAPSTSETESADDSSESDDAFALPGDESSEPPAEEAADAPRIVSSSEELDASEASDSGQIFSEEETTGDEPSDAEPVAPSDEQSANDEQSDADDDATASGTEEATDDESADEDEGVSGLAALRQRLNQNSTEADGFADRVAEIAESLDDETRRQIAEASTDDLVEATVLALLKNGVFSAGDLVDGLPNDN